MVPGIDFFDRNAAAGDNGFFNGTECPHMQGNRLDAAAQMQPLCLGEGVGFGVRRDPRQPQHRQDQLCRQQGVENVAEVAVGTVGKIPLDPFVQLLRSQTGFQVDLQPVVLWLPFRIRALALSTSGPDTPKWVNSISPSSSKMHLFPRYSRRITFRRESPMAS